MTSKALIGLIALFALIVVGFQGLYTVSEIEQAIVLKFGNPQRVVREAGLHFKIPFVEQVLILDRRILNLDVPPEEVIAADQRRLVVDAIARFKIIDPLEMYKTTRTEGVAANRIATLVSSNTRQVLGREDFLTLLSGSRADLMIEIRDAVNSEAAAWGIEIIDVRIKRADLPQENSQRIFQQMIAERQQEAEQIRADGRGNANAARAEADRDKRVRLANAERDGQIVRGLGDAQAVTIYADAYGRDEEFFAFYRSMQAYRVALGKDDTTMVLSPDSEFFRFFEQSDLRPEGSNR